MGTEYTRIRVCCDCGERQEIRRDNASERCVSCAAKIRGAKGNATRAARIKFTACEVCGNQFRTQTSANHGRGSRFCSWACRRAAASITRICKHCGNDFIVSPGRLSGKSNSAGNFCSRPCYEAWMCDADRVNGRGSRWRTTRNAAIKLSPFCALCGKRDQLDVHHIAPFRHTSDNSQDNLIPLCKKHHKRAEVMTNDLLAAGCPADDIKFIFGNMLREKQAVTAVSLTSDRGERFARAN